MISIRVPVVLVFVFCAVSTFTLENEKSEDWGSNGGKQLYKRETDHTSRMVYTEAQNYTQCMDNNDKTCSKTWSQRYWVNAKFYKKGNTGPGPVFFWLGHEGPQDGRVDSGSWLEYARQFGAVLVCLEHRFYGQSFPTKDKTYKSLKLLTSQQALADAARFIEDFKSTNNYVGSKVVAFGGSYGGNLAAWFRQKYPKSANAAVSSSAPLEALFDFPGFLRTVSEVMFLHNRSCYYKIREVFSCLENLVNNKRCRNSKYTNKDQIDSALHQCQRTDFQDPLQKDGFFLWMSNTWNTNYPKTENMPKCKILNKQDGGDILDDYGNFLSAIGEGNCSSGIISTTAIKKSSKQVSKMLRSRVGTESEFVEWYWQTCYEFGYYNTADLKYKVFGTVFSTLSYVNDCQKLFGSRFTSEYIQDRIAGTNAYYKGKNNDGTCIIFVNGGYDPWHSLGINFAKETSSKNDVIIIPTGEHGADLRKSKKQDVKIAQRRIQKMIGRYLKDRNCV